MEEMNVTKRDGTVEIIQFDKILRRVKTLGRTIEPALTLNFTQLVINVVDKLHDNIKTQQIDELTAQECASQVLNHPDFGVLAGRIVVSNNHKSTCASFGTVTDVLESQLNADYVATVRTHALQFQSMLRFERDYALDYFGYKTLERAYLMKSDGIVVERPQHMWLRVAIALHGADFAKVQQTYELMSLKFMTHATPTLFNAGTKHPQLSSCFLVAMKEDSIDGIYETLSDCAKISKWAGGIGLHVHNIRAKGSLIRGTNGTSNGLVPMLRAFNETARYVDQGGGKRNGSFSIYLSPEHPDIEAWLELKKNTGDENARARDLFYGLWVPDLFMKRVEQDAPWSLFCPDACPRLNDVYGAEYDALYERYEAEGKAAKQVSARALWFKVLDAQMETGTPSLLYKDACNLKSNQRNVGTIKSSNLCTEIIQYSSSEETAVCNLASIALGAFVNSTGEFDYAKLHEVTEVVTFNLNRVIDVTYYPTEKAKRSNLLHRPIGIGVQGLADAFFKMNVAFHSPEALEINQRIFETMYHAAVTASVRLAQENGAYATFADSPMSKGQFQFDMWGVKPSGRYDWEALRTDVMRYGVRNSLLVAPMPTASTSQILGNTECFEPITSNLYTRRTNAGEFVVINHFLVHELLALGKWNDSMKNSIIANHGSVQHLDLPAEMKKKYLTVWEIPMRHIIDMARDRGAYICQSQSLNLFMADPDPQRLTSMHFYAWKQGLKTGIYYLRRKPRYQPQQVTLDPTVCLTCSA
jgi:ribonucleoside-diphosphate reductase alpha chain